MNQACNQHLPSRIIEESVDIIEENADPNCEHDRLIQGRNRIRLKSKVYREHQDPKNTVSHKEDRIREGQRISSFYTALRMEVRKRAVISRARTLIRSAKYRSLLKEHSRRSREILKQTETTSSGEFPFDKLQKLQEESDRAAQVEFKLPRLIHLHQLSNLVKKTDETMAKRTTNELLWNEPIPLLLAAGGMEIDWHKPPSLPSRPGEESKGSFLDGRRIIVSLPSEYIDRGRIPDKELVAMIKDVCRQARVRRDKYMNLLKEHFENLKKEEEEEEELRMLHQGIPREFLPYVKVSENDWAIIENTSNLQKGTRRTSERPGTATFQTQKCLEEIKEIEQEHVRYIQNASTVPYDDGRKCTPQARQTTQPDENSTGDPDDYYFFHGNDE